MKQCLILIGLLLASATPASMGAQEAGLPVINNGVPIGIGIGAAVGFANADAGKATTVGVHGALGIGFFGAYAGIARVSPEEGESGWSPGFNGTLRLFGGPLVPLRVLLQAGVSHTSMGGVKSTHIPVGIGFAATIPNPAFAIKPWIAPRLDMVRHSAGGESDSDTHFAMSGGVDLGLLSGISLRAAYDRVWGKPGKPSILSFGLGYSM